MGRSTRGAVAEEATFVPFPGTMTAGMPLCLTSIQGGWFSMSQTSETDSLPSNIKVGTTQTRYQQQRVGRR